MDSYNNLIDGYKAFRKQYLDEEYSAYRTWAGNNQAPEVMIIGCSDSRVNPAILTHAGLGDIFSVNNVANIVPAYESGDHSHHSVGSAVQYAVEHLKIKHIIVMGHSGCGGIKALLTHDEAQPSATSDSDYISDWVHIVKEAKTRIEADMPSAPLADKAQACEMEAALVSIANLITYPWVKKAIDENRLNLHAWYFHIESGQLMRYIHEEGQYRKIIEE